jgi:hypothetical protein
MGTVALYCVAFLWHTRGYPAITGGDAMSEQGVYRVQAKALITIKRDIYALDVYDAVRLATERIDEWEVHDWDDAEIKRVLDVEYLRDE